MHTLCSVIQGYFGPCLEIRRVKFGAAYVDRVSVFIFNHDIPEGSQNKAQKMSTELLSNVQIDVGRAIRS